MNEDDTTTKAPKESDIKSTDADFTAKPIEVKPEVKAEETKSQNKSRYKPCSTLDLVNCYWYW